MREVISRQQKESSVFSGIYGCTEEVSSRQGTPLQNEIRNLYK